MNRLRQWWLRLRNSLWPDRFSDDDVNAELKAHFGLIVEHHEDRGMPSPEARAAAFRELGSIPAIRESVRDTWKFRAIETIVQDLRYAIRGLGRNPGFAVVAILTLAIGIGGVTAMFGIAYGVLLRPLPYADPDSLVAIWQEDERYGGRGPIAVDDVRDIREATVVFENVGAYRERNYLWKEPESIVAEIVRAASIDPRMLAVLGAEPNLGRGFVAEDHQPDPSVVILSHDFWRTRFGSDPDVLGRTLHFVDQPGWNLTVIGVMPEDFRFNALNVAGGAGPYVWEPQILLPFAPSPSRVAAGREARILFLVGRLHAGVSLDVAQEDLDRVAAGLRELYPAIGDRRYNAVPLQREVGGSARSLVLLFFGAVGFVLLIAVANVANLMLTRSVNREREIAVRLAMGSSPFRLVRMLVTESLVLSLAGALAGLTLAHVTLDWLVSRLPEGFPRLEAIAIDWNVLAFTVALAVLTAVAFGLVPGLLGLQINIDRGLRHGARGFSEGGMQARLRNLLVAGEITLAVVLLTAAGLLGQSFWNLVHQDQGIDPENLLFATVQTYGPPSDRLEGASLAEQIVARLEQFPAVRSASYGSVNGAFSVSVEGGVATRMNVVASSNAIGRNYFQTLGVPIERGRLFDMTASDEVVINDRMARELWPGLNPVGRRFAVGRESGPDNPSLTVSGVVPDFKTFLTRDEVMPAFYRPCGHEGRVVAADCNGRGLVVRTRDDPAEVIEVLRSEIVAVDPEATLYGSPETSDQLRELAGDMPQLLTALFGTFAGAALLLTVVGVYGVTSYAAARRVPEVGVRMALGATGADIARMFLKHAMALILLGACAGLLGAAVLTRLLTAYLYEVEPGDPWILMTTLFTVAGAALLASFIPVRRACATDPTVALRSE